MLHFKSVEYFAVYTHGKQQNDSNSHCTEDKKNLFKIPYAIIGVFILVMIYNVGSNTQIYYMTVI